MADAAAQIHLHPLVLINISDHVVRFRVSDCRQRVLGAVIGSQEGRRVDVHNSFELVVDDSGTPDFEFFQQRIGQYLEVFPRYEFLGWYSTGVAPLESDHLLHKRMQEASSNENPFCIFIDADTLSDSKSTQSEDLPVKVYDFATHIVAGETSFQWSEVPYVIDTVEAERIAVSHVAKTATTTSEGHSSDFTQHAGGLSNAVVMLSNRVGELIEMAQAMKEGRVPKSAEALRQMKSICQALEATHPEALRREFAGELNDGGLVVLLASMSKVCANTSDLLDKFQVAHDKKHRQRHHYPFG